MVSAPELGLPLPGTVAGLDAAPDVPDGLPPTVLIALLSVAFATGGLAYGIGTAWSR